MADRYFNPFQGIDINIPVELHDAFTRYCQAHQNTTLDQSPFPRMVDLWFLAVCVAARANLSPVDIAKQETRKIIEGSIFGSDPEAELQEELQVAFAGHHSRVNARQARERMKGRVFERVLAVLRRSGLPPQADERTRQNIGA